MTDLQKAIEIAERRFQRNNTLTRNVMVAFTSGYRSEERTRRHLRLMRDAGGLYVRIGKRGQVKKYLTEMAGARIVDTNLVVFYEV